MLHLARVAVMETLPKQQAFLETFYFFFKNWQVFWRDNHKPIGLFIASWVAFLDYRISTIRYPFILSIVTGLRR
jgi:uncharacterized iron-regulated membrane protein